MSDEICKNCEVQICPEAEGHCELIAKLRAELEAARAEIEQLRWRIANNIGITTKETGDLTLQEGLAEIVIRRTENKKLESELETARSEFEAERKERADDTAFMVKTTDELIEARRRIKRLEAFVRPSLYCPCCGQTEKCLDGCTYATDYPVEAATMVAAREAMKGNKP